MKKLITLALFIVATTGMATAQDAPKLKIGVTNTALIFEKMPEVKAIQKELEDYGKQLDAAWQLKVKAFQEKAQAFQQEVQAGNKTPKQQQDEGLELQKTEQTLQSEQQASNLKLQKKQAELLEPLQEKITTAIENVRKAGGYSLILDESNQSGLIVLAKDPKLDVTPLILKELGIAEN